MLRREFPAREDREEKKKERGRGRARVSAATRRKKRSRDGGVTGMNINRGLSRTIRLPFTQTTLLPLPHALALFDYETFVRFATTPLQTTPLPGCFGAESRNPSAGVCAVSQVGLLCFAGILRVLELLG